MEQRRNEDFDIISYRQEDSVRRQKKPVKQSKSRTRQEQEREYAAKNRARELRKRKRRRKVFIARFICAFFIFTVAGIAALSMYSVLLKEDKTDKAEKDSTGFQNVINFFSGGGKNWTAEEMLSMLEEKGISCSQEFLTINEYSRPGEELKKVTNIFVHYTANPGTSALNNKSYFQNLAQTHETSASAHFVIGYEGEVVQCIPLDEIAYAVKGRNYDSISIECCYLDKSGKFTEETYETLVEFSAILLENYGLQSTDLRRHYDEGGKLCPKYYVENEDEWERFVEDVGERQQLNKNDS